jgi:hypothetical protein
MDQPTAERALAELEVLLGEWTLEAVPPGGEAWPGDARTRFEWLEGSDQRLLVGRTTIEMSEAPDSVVVIGCDAANETYFQLYSDDRNVCRIYAMSLGSGEWRLSREGEPFNQLFTAKFSEDGNTIEGRWETWEDGAWVTDFDLIYRRAE